MGNFSQIFAREEFVALTVGAGRMVRAVRIRNCGRGREVMAMAAERSMDGEELSATLELVLRRVGATRGGWLLLGAALAHGELFQTTLPEMKNNEMRSALEFEAERKLPRLPENFRLQFFRLPSSKKKAVPDAAAPDAAPKSESSGENAVPDVIALRCYLFPYGGLLDLGREMQRTHRKVDEFLYPFLALPSELSAGATVFFPELEPDYCWRNEAWVACDELSESERTACNRELLEILRKECVLTAGCRSEGVGEDTLYRDFVAPLCMALFAARGHLRSSLTRNAISVLPKELKPARLRTQLRLAVFLSALLLGLGGFRMVEVARQFSKRYVALEQELAALKNSNEKAKKKLKSSEKLGKEWSRVNELKIGDDLLLPLIAELSQALPDDVLVSNLRISDSSVDLTLQTESTEVDLVNLLGRLPAFKVSSANQRQLPTGVMIVNAKLARQSAGGGLR